MYYIFNKSGKLVGTCDFEPDIEDLKSRDEYFVKNDEDLNISRLVGGKYGSIYESVETQEEVTQKETKKVLQQRVVNLVNTDWVVSRHFEEKMLGKETTLSDTQISECLKYRQSLRDITQLKDFPFVVFPQQPDFLE